MPAWRGKKSAGQRTEIIEEALPFVQAAESIPEVLKISLGVISPTSLVLPKENVFVLVAGLLWVQVFGSSQEQDIWIYTIQPGKIRARLVLIEAQGKLKRAMPAVF